MPQAKNTPHRFLKKPPPRLAVVHQAGCTGCAGSPVCVSFCETVTVRDEVVDAIRILRSPEPGPLELAYVEFDKCIGCGLCARVCPWDAITMHSSDEAHEIVDGLTVKHFECVPETTARPEQGGQATVPSQADR
jgi:ferredoxin